MKTNLIVLSCLVVFGVAALPAQSRHSDDTSPALSLQEVTLFTSGVAEFLHRGTVEGSGELTLTVPAQQMNDVLRSITLMDLNGGSVEVVSYPGGEDPSRQLARFPVNLAEAHRLYHVLRQLRGMAVQVQHEQDGRTSTVNGTLVGADEQALVVVSQRDRALLELPMEAVASVRFTDERTQIEFERALAALEDLGSPAEQRALVVKFTGSGSRTLEVRYLMESPQWHVSYRAVIQPQSSTALLQGWAHLDNTHNSDWDGVTVTLVSAQPVTYRHQVWQPRYVVRPPWRDAAPSAPARVPSPAPSRVQAEVMSRSAADESFISSVIPTTTAQELMTGMAFTLPDPVTVRRGGSIMVPLVNQSLPVQLLRFFDPQIDGEQPRAAIRLTNNTGRQLPPGPVTVYEGGRYVGDGGLPVMVADSQTVVTYARDLDLRITSSTGGVDEQLSTVSIVDGVLLVERRARRTTTYRITSTAPSRSVVIAHRMQSGWSLVEPRSGVQQEGTVTQITTSSRQLTVVEEQVREQRLALGSIPDDQLTFYGTNRLMDPTVRRTLQNIQELQRTVAERRRARQTLDEQVASITADQARIATNMAQLDRNSTLYRRYTSDLSRQEDELRIIREDLARAQREETQAQAALREYLRTLGVQ